ncbi:MAG TPA: TlpA disulfide reductase family protein [Acidimicrobiales bacterium]|jgi:thiol-disulfide isomerase/thioredoxin
MLISIGVGVALAIALIAVVSVVTGGKVTNDKKNVLVSSALVGRHVKSWSLEGLSGGTINAPWSTGHASVLVFFASFCGPCQGEMPKLAAYIRHHSTSPVDVVAMDSDDKRAAALSMIKKDDVTFPVAFDPNGTVITGTFGFQEVPESVFLSARGVVKGVYFGAIPDKELKAGLKLLKS